MRRLAVLFLLLSLPIAHAQDPLKSSACAEALAQLQAARGDAASALREHAASACLGGSGTPAPRSNRWAVPPAAVSPPRIEPPAPSRAGAGAPLPPPVALERPRVITGCDGSGCWASDGSRLNRVGPMLVGPTGVCSVQGSAVFCP